MKYFLTYEEDCGHIVVRDENGHLQYSIHTVDLAYTKLQIEGKLIINNSLVKDKEIELR